jgi:hypothetical protein|tara:strand:- start:127 stop:312 length:186 start_codon:yes stop_codon:yes gene_type:complete
MTFEIETKKKEIRDRLEDAISETGLSMLRLKNGYHQLKVIMADLEYELKMAKQTEKDKGLS